MKLGRITGDASPLVPTYPITLTASATGIPSRRAVRITIEMRVEVAVGPATIELVYGQAACTAEKQFPDDAVVNRMNWRAAKLHDVNRFMTMSEVHFVETVVKI